MFTNVVIALIGALGVGLALAGLLYPVRQAQALRRQKGDTAGLAGVERLAEKKDDVELPPLLDRVLGPAIRDLVGFMGRNPARREGLERRLRRSGWRYKGAGDFYANKVMTAGLFFLGGAVFVAITGNLRLFFVPLLLGVMGLYVPDYEVSAALKRRRQALYVEMAFTLDQLALLMEAGLAFQQALKELAEKGGGGIFMAALRSAVAWIRLGTPVPESLRKMMDDLPEEAELEKFVSRAQKGGPMAEACRAQAGLMRSKVEHDLLSKGLRLVLVITTIGGALILPALALLVVGPPIVLALRIFQF